MDRHEQGECVEPPNLSLPVEVLVELARDLDDPVRESATRRLIAHLDMEGMLYEGRRPEDVMLSFSLSEQLLPAVEDIQLAELVRSRLASSSADGSFDELAVELGFSPSDFE